MDQEQVQALIIIGRATLRLVTFQRASKTPLRDTIIVKSVISQENEYPRAPEKVL